MLSVFVVSCMCAALVSGYRSGAPRSTCQSLLPTHGTKQGTQSPYMLRIEGLKTTYSASEAIKVCVDGRDFQGLILQARLHGSSSRTPYGTFSAVAADTKQMTCTAASDTVTHDNTATKGSGTCFTWKAPDSDQGAISFIATVNQYMRTFWTDIRSSSLTFHSGSVPNTSTSSPNGGTTKTTTTTTTTTSTTTLPPPTGSNDDSSESGEESNPGSDDASTTTSKTPTTTATTTTTTTTTTTPAVTTTSNNKRKQDNLQSPENSASTGYFALFLQTILLVTIGLLLSTHV